MAGSLVQLALSNLFVSAALACIAYAVHRHGRYPTVAHLLWVLVLVKLVTPPFLALTVARLPANGAAANHGAAPAGQLAATLIDPLFSGLVAAWMIGSGIVLLVSLARIWRFDRLLRRTSSPAGEQLQWALRDVAYELGMARAPRLYLTTAHIAPMTWWVGGRIRVVVPAALLTALHHDQLRWVLAHELAHVKRRDHLVRWLEWLACVAFWWNPVAWFARATLRLDEEAACDALVVEHLGVGGRSYARALLAVVELLSRRGLQPPAVATGIDGGGSLERRFRLLVSRRGARRVPHGLVVGLLGVSLLVMPLGLSVGEEAPARRGPGPGLATDAQTSAAETAFLGASPSPRVAGGLADDVETAKLSANVSATKASARTTSRKATATRAAKRRLSKGTSQAKKATRVSRAEAAKARQAAAAPVVEFASGGASIRHL